MINFKALLFDLDGTLLDTAPDFITALNIQLTRHGRTPISDDDVRVSVTNGSAGLIQAGFNISADHPHFEAIRSEYLDLYLNNIAEKTVAFPGLDRVLEHCERNNIPWGIVTNKPWIYSHAVLQQLKLLERAAAVVCPDHVNQAKPHPEAMFLAAKQLSINPIDCLYVGDHRRDIDAGAAAGMTTVAAGWGYIAASEDISNWGADHIVAQPQQLHQLLFNH